MSPDDMDEDIPQVVLHKVRGRLVDEDGFEYTDWDN